MPKRKLTASKMTEPVTEGNTEDTPCFGEVPESSCDGFLGGFVVRQSGEVNTIGITKHRKVISDIIW